MPVPFRFGLPLVQAILLTVTDRHIPYAEKAYRELIHKGIRAEKDFRNEKLGFKVREAQLQKIPYMLVVGDREEKGRDPLAPQTERRGHEGHENRGIHRPGSIRLPQPLI